MINFVDSTQAGARQVTPQDLDDAFAATLPIAGGQMTGPLLLSEDPKAATEAATKNYVDAAVTGGTITNYATSADLSAEVTNRTNAINAAIARLVLSQALFLPDPTLIDPTGVADSTAGLQNSIDRAVAAGGGVVLWPAGHFKVSSTLVVSVSGVRIIGAGHGAFHDSSPYVVANTLLIWAGAVKGIMLAVGPVQAATSQKLTGVDVIGVALQATPDLVTAGADYGLLLTSVQHSQFDVFVAEFGVAAVAFTCGNALSEAANCEGNTLSLRFRQENTSGTALQLGGSAIGNTCFNEFPIVFGYINKGIGIDFQSSDNNRFGRVWIDRVIGGTGTNVYFRSDAQFGGNGACARVNTIEDLSFSVHAGFIYAEGTEATGAQTSSFGNRVLRFDLANALPTVVYGTGASLFLSWNTSPIGLRDSNIKQYSGYMQHTNGVVDFWNTTGLLGAGTVSTFTMEFACTRILEVSCQPLGIETASGAPSAYNYDASTRTDSASNKFDLYANATAYYSHRGKALAPI